MTEGLEDRPVLNRHCKAEVANSVAHIPKTVDEDIGRVGLLNPTDRLARRCNEILAGCKNDIARMGTTAVLGTFVGHPKTRNERVDAVPAPICQRP